jgi:hypothetical protein
MGWHDVVCLHFNKKRMIAPASASGLESLASLNFLPVLHPLNIRPLTMNANVIEVSSAEK